MTGPSIYAADLSPGRANPATWRIWLREAVSSGFAFAAIAIIALAALAAFSFRLSSDFPMAPWLSLLPSIVVLAVAALIKASAGSRSAIMILLAVVVFFTDAQLRVRGAGDTTVDWQSVLKFAIWMGAGIVGIAWLPPAKYILSRPGPALILAYVAIAMVSSLYAPSFIYSFGCALAVGAMYAFGFTLTRTLSLVAILWTLVIAFAAFLVAGWVAFAVDRELAASPFWTMNGMEYRFCGISGQADNMGSICAKYLGAVFLLWRMGGCKLRFAVPFAALGVVCLVASDARTGMISLVVAIVAVMLPRTRWGIAGATLLGLVVILGMMTAPSRLDAISAGLSRSGDPSEVYTLTGRFEIWDFAREKAMESPLAGYGYNSSKVILGNHLGFENGLMVDTAHNLWLQNMLSVGLIGTVPMAALFIWLGVQYFRRPSDFRDFYAVLSLVAGIAENQAFGTTPTILMLIFFTSSTMPDSMVTFGRQPRLRLNPVWRLQHAP